MSPDLPDLFLQLKTPKGLPEANLTAYRKVRRFFFFFFFFFCLLCA